MSKLNIRYNIPPSPTLSVQDNIRWNNGFEILWYLFLWDNYISVINNNLIIDIPKFKLLSFYLLQYTPILTDSFVGHFHRFQRKTVKSDHTPDRNLAFRTLVLPS